MSQAAVTEVLQFVVSAGLEALDCLKPLIENGFTSKAAVLDMTKQEVDRVLPKSVRTKFWRAIQKQSKQSSKAENKRGRKEEEEGEGKKEGSLKKAKLDSGAAESIRVVGEEELGQLESDQKSILVNRSPVMILWGTVVAERLGFDFDSALSLSSMMSSLNAKSKGRSLGIYESSEGNSSLTPPEGWTLETASLLGRDMTVFRNHAAIRGHQNNSIIQPHAVRQSLSRAFGDSLSLVYSSMKLLAAEIPLERLVDQNAGYRAYCIFRPDIPQGRAGWGAKGRLELDVILHQRQNPELCPQQPSTPKDSAQQLQQCEKVVKASILQVLSDKGPLALDNLVAELAPNYSKKDVEASVQLLQLDGEVYVNKQNNIAVL